MRRQLGKILRLSLCTVLGLAMCLMNLLGHEEDRFRKDLLHFKQETSMSVAGRGLDMAYLPFH